MEFFRDANYDFMGWRWVWLTISGVAMAASVVALFALGQLNIGIDFAGGTQLTVRFAERPDIDRLRTSLEQDGLAAAQIQRFGPESANEVLIKTPILGESVVEDQRRVVGALERVYGSGGSGVNVNEISSERLALLLRELDPDSRLAGDPEAAADHYATVAEAVIDERGQRGVLASWEDLAAVGGLSDAARAALESRVHLGAFAVIGAESVGPQVGSELRTKGLLAVLFSIAGMLAYIWVRFELRFGVAAVVAIVHDVTVTLGLYAIAGYEFNLTTIAAFLTVVGYSVNDTVVIFDRVRENLRRSRRDGLFTVLNRSINQTLSRTVLTGGSVLLVLLSLFFFGGAVIQGFAFVLLVGLVVGTYSTICVASPVVMLWERWVGGRANRESVAAVEPAGQRATR
jgi:preprotein translocase subunit SecF